MTEQKGRHVACTAHLARMLLGMALAIPAVAQDYNYSIPEPFEAPGGSMGRTADGSFGVESIDPFTGGLKIVATDLVVPANGGLDLAVTRNYQSFIRPSGDASRAYQRGRTVTGIGWDLHYGRLWAGSTHAASTDLAATNTAQGCRDASWTDTRFNPVLEMPDGSRRQFVAAHSGADYAYISQDRWLLKCLPTSSNPQGFGGARVISPDGIEYTLNFRNKVSDQPISNHITQASSNYAFHVTRIQHPNGTFITVNYVPHSQVPYAVISTVTHSEAGTITFGYDNVNNSFPSSTALRTYTHNSRTWTLGYMAAPGLSGKSYLETVTRPDGRITRYAYYTSNGSPGAFSLQRVTTPLGGVVEYTYASTSFPVRDNVVGTVINYVVRTKEVRRGGGADNKTWYYNYRPASGGQTSDYTDIKGPFSCETYEHQVGVSQGTIWRHGLLLSKSTYEYNSSQSSTGACGNDLLYRETLTWEGQEVIPGSSNAPQGLFQKPLYFDNLVNVPRLTRKVARLDGTDYTTEYQNPDDYGNPRRIVETGREPSGNANYVTASRTTEITYYNNTTAWIIGRTDDETVQSAGLTYATPTSSPSTTDYVIGRSFYSGDRVGLLQTETRAGVSTDFNYHTGSTQGGELSSITDANGYPTSFTSYKRGTPQRSERAIDGAGTLQVVQRSVNNTGTIGSVTDGENKQIVYGYNDVNLLSSVSTTRSDDDNISITRVSSNTDDVIIRGSYREVRQYDGFGSLIRTDWMQNGGSTLIYQRFEYDAAGRVIRKYQPNSSSYITVNYDALNRVTSEVHPGGITVSFQYLSDNRVVITDERGFQTRLFHRAYGEPMAAELMLIRAPRGDLTNDGLVRQTYIDRNRLGQVLSVQQGAMNGSGTIDNAVTRQYRYNSKFFLFEETNPESGVTQYGHDFVGNVTSKSVGGSAATIFTLDRLYRTDLVTFPNSTGTVDFDYYLNDLPRFVVRGGTRWDYVYDANNNLTHETLSLSGSDYQTRSYTYQHHYNTRDQLSGLTYPAASGLRVDYVPDALGRATRVDAYQGSSGVTPFATSVTFHPNGQLNTLVLGNGVTTTFTQDARLRPYGFSAQATLNGQLKHLVNRTYGYDNANNVTSIDDLTPTNADKSMSYDGLNRLRTSNGFGGTGAISYYPNDNIHTMSFGTGGSSPYSITLGYDSATNRLSSVSGSRVRSAYAYDAYGNVTNNGEFGGNASRYVFDDDSLLRAVQRSDQSPQYQYWYDGNRRMTREYDVANASNRYKATSQSGLTYFEEDLENSFTKDHVYLQDRLISTRMRCVSSTDSDGDGISNCVESKLGMSRTDAGDADDDTDGDGLTNLAEVQAGTDIYQGDTDADGLNDGYERNNGLVAYYADSSADTDGDGLSNLAEFQLGTKPNDSDTDNDGIPDGTDPNPKFNPATLVPIITILLGD